MDRPRADLVVAGQVVTGVLGGELQVSDAIGIAAGRVVSVGPLDAVRADAAHGARTVAAQGRAVIPGLHDAHLHLVDLARTRRMLDLVPARDVEELFDLVAGALGALAPDAWLWGRGWSADTLPPRGAERLAALVGHRLAFLRSRDGHSAWASPAVLRRAGVDSRTADPTGGRIERGAGGEPTGIVREKAVDLVARFVERLRGSELRRALDEAVAELSAFGITGVTDAGDFTADNGEGPYAALGDSFSVLASLPAELSRRLRVTANVPGSALDDAVARGLITGYPLDASAGTRCGWVKLFADGALGSRTAALFEPYSCGELAGDRGLMTLTAERLDEVLVAGRTAGLRVAVHAIGDLANATVLDGFERAVAERDRLRDRIEHAQLTRPAERTRMARLGLVASMQPAHCPSDADAIERCWAGREGNAYAWRSIAAAGVTLAFGSDAPVEPVNPWLGMHAAANRRYPGDADPWQPAEAIAMPDALAAYTRGPALALGRDDEGHLGIGARADLAVLDCTLEALVAAGDDLVNVRSELTLVDGVEVPRA
jgi:hypothetical protein